MSQTPFPASGFDNKTIPGALPESAYDPVGSLAPGEVRPSTGLMADGRPWPEEAGQKWPWIYDPVQDLLRLATQEDLDHLQAVAVAYARIMEAVTLARQNLTLASKGTT